MSTAPSQFPSSASTLRVRLLFFAAFFASACGSALALTSGSLHAQGGVDLDTIQAGQFDNGKMWTFEYAPSDYFTQTYGFTADQAWFDRARLSVLRIPGCSASFVSPNGLVATNHHCVRGSVSRVSGQGEGLLDNGFFARTLEDERRIPDYYADQLLAVVDVSDDVFAAADRATTLQAVQARLKQEHAAVGDSVWVQIVALYHGGRYSAYVFRRFTDVRLVAAVELQLGFFGGDPDNFTYPRYALDFAFLRVYDAEGNPYRPTHYFTMAGGGVQEGDAVFVIGNPGQTNRLRTVAQLEYQRDVSVPATQRYLETRHGLLADFLEAYPEEGEALGIRNQIFGLSNSLKAYTGRLDALNDPVILARRSDSEHQLREAIAADPELSERYAGLFDRMAQIQRDKEEYAAVFSASLGQTGQYSSATLRRALVADWYLEAQAAGAPADTLSMIRQEFQRIGDHPAAIEHGLLAARFEDFERYFGPEHLITQTALQGLSPIEAATAMLDGTPLSRGQTAAEALSGDRLSPAEDPALRLVAAILPTAAEYRQAFNRLQAEEVELESDLGRVRFAVYGESVPPDGTFSPRITDGVVKGYEYNGTLAPPYTSFFGLYDRFYGHNGAVDWELPEEWRTPPAGLDLSTPLNFVSTSDTYGGNSGSPAVTPELELVGLNFDRNIDGLSRDFIYLPEQGRNVMVDVRAIRATLDHVYDLDRIVAELDSGQLYRSEEEADAAGGQ